MRGNLLLYILLVVCFSCKKEQIEDLKKAKACFTIEGDTIAGEEIVFNSTCTAFADSFYWEFGDGGASSSPNPTYIYVNQGKFLVRLHVYNDYSSDVQEKEIKITKPEVFLHQGVISREETWLEGNHRIIGGVSIEGGSVTIQPGCHVAFSKDAYFNVGVGTPASSTLIANGTGDKPIYFTADEGFKASGNWMNMKFGKGNSGTSSLNHCLIEYGGGGDNSRAMIELRETDLSIRNTMIRYSASSGIYLDSMAYFDHFEGNTITSCSDQGLVIHLNQAHTIGTNNQLDKDNGIVVYGNSFTRAYAEWEAQSSPYYIPGTIIIGSGDGSVLKLLPGVNLALARNSTIHVGKENSKRGDLQLEGVDGNPVRVTSRALKKSPGDWNSIIIGRYSFQSSIDHAIIEYGGGDGSLGAMLVYKQGDVALSNSLISKSGSIGMLLEEDVKISFFSYNNIKECNTYPVSMFASQLHAIGDGNIFETSTGIHVHANSIGRGSFFWTAQNCPYYIEGYVYIGSETETSLTIDTGTILKFLTNSGMKIGYPTGKKGKLIAIGSPSNNIVFTSSAPENEGFHGQWNGVFFYNGTLSGSIINNCTFSYGGGFSSASGLLYANDTGDKLTIMNSFFTYSISWGIYLTGSSHPVLENLSYHDNMMGNLYSPGL